MSYKDEKKQNQQRREELLEEAKNLTDEKLLDEVLAFSLDEKEHKAFESMRMHIGRLGSVGLSARQREWAENVYVKMGFDAEDTGALNLVSSGKVPRGNVPTFEWEQNRPLKPPGR